MKALLILVLAVIIFVSGCTTNTPAATPLVDGSSDNVGKAGINAVEEAKQIKSQLQIALTSGGISPESYEEISRKIAQIESTGYDVAELGQMLSQLTVGSKPQSHQVGSGQQASSKLPVLKNLGVNFGRWNPSTNRAGDFLFRDGTFNDKIIVEFGLLVNGSNGAKRLPEMTFILPVGTPVVSPIDGIVSDISVIEWSQDYAVQLKTDNGSEWMAGYEHLINLKVSEGDQIRAGQVVGEAAPWNGGTGFAELVVWKGGTSENDIKKHCPFDALEESLKTAYEEKIMQMVVDWEKFKGKNIYQEEKWILPGCLFLEMTEAEANNPHTEVQPAQMQGNTASPIIRWEYDWTENKWTAQNPPACPPLIFDSPVDVNKATSVLYPGQYRPDYKPHGGFRFDNQNNNDMEVRAPFDGYAWRANRRYASGQIQYNIEILHPCGINARLDHLLELAPEFQKLAENLPQPKEGDSRTTELGSWRQVKKGELIATKVGVAGNVFMDWGMYDFRAPNDASINASYSQEHWTERWNAFHALCWLNYLPSGQKIIVKALPGADGRAGKTSDYC